MPNSAIEIIDLEGNQPVEALFRLVSDMPTPVWLDSSSSLSLDGSRFHIISASPQTSIHANYATKEESNVFFEAAQTSLKEFAPGNTMSGIPFQGGLIGYVSYELGAAGIGIDSSEETPLEPSFKQLGSKQTVQTAYLGLYLWGLIVDKLNDSKKLVFHPACDPQTREAVLCRFVGSKQPLKSTPPFELSNRFERTISKQTYATDLSRINHYIHAGDVYQVNYAQHFRAPYSGSTLDAYLQLRKFAPAPYSGYLELNGKALLCHSPEQFIELTGRHVRTSPIKGTAPRSGDELLDQCNAEVLQSSEKDRSENLMIVDLMRNDLGKVCTPGSVQTSKLFELQSYSNVHHLVSEIRGKLRPEYSALDLLASVIPAGSVTGAPKKRAVEIIHELETEQRSFYCGNLGYASLCGNMDFNIGIRSLVADGKHIHCWGGGGIVADSSADKEYEETLHKVGGLMSELEKRFLNGTDRRADKSA